MQRIVGILSLENVWGGSRTQQIGAALKMKECEWLPAGDPGVTSVESVAAE